MNQKTMQIVVDEIYNQVSLPIIEANNKALDKVVIKKDQYLKDREKYLVLQEQIKKLQKECEVLEFPYEHNKTFNGYKFNSWGNPFGEEEAYLKFQKRKILGLKEVPSKSSIEKEIILSGNKDIPALIELIVTKLKG